MAWGISIVLPCEHPFGRIATLDNWFAFGFRILRDTLQAISILALAISVSVFLPRIGLVIERVILKSRRWQFLTVTMLLTFLTSVLFNYIVFESFPNVIDEIAMLFQAKLLATGRLFAETPKLIDFFDTEFIVADGPRWYGKYFIGSSLILIPGVWLGVPWIINPILSTAAIYLTYIIGFNLFNDKIARVATLLMLISPFRVVIFASMMSHPVCLVTMTLFALSAIKAVKDPTRFGWALVAGSSLGFALNCRPLTAVAMGSVIGLAALYNMPWRQFRWQTVAAFVAPLLLFAFVFFSYNKALTGDIFVTPFNKWSPNDHLGFGPDVGLEYWPEVDRGYSLEKALFKNTYFNLEGLGINLLGWGHVTFLLLLWPILFSSWPKRTWALAAIVAGLMLAYFFYITHAVLAGLPRYWSEVMPMMFMIVAIALVGIRRKLPLICQRFDIRPAVRTGRAACWLAGLMITIWGVPYGYGMIINEWCFDWKTRGDRDRVYRLVKETNLGNALVFIETGYYRDPKQNNIDEYRLLLIRNDPDLNGSIIYARDLGARNTELINQYPQRKAYRFVRDQYGLEDQLVLISSPDIREEEINSASKPP
ncbi:MAG: glycosyltransferase family 39 protein [Planctomycetota bacterium]|nr:MAG: glycosyltransferase family 39 protein [Planctomycetota bacterium]